MQQIMLYRLAVRSGLLQNRIHNLRYLLHRKLEDFLTVHLHKTKLRLAARQAVFKTSRLAVQNVVLRSVAADQRLHHTRLVRPDNRRARSIAKQDAGTAVRPV